VHRAPSRERRTYHLHDPRFGRYVSFSYQLASRADAGSSRFMRRASAGAHVDTLDTALCRESALALDHRGIGFSCSPRSPELPHAASARRATCCVTSSSVWQTGRQATLQLRHERSHPLKSVPRSMLKLCRGEGDGPQTGRRGPSAFPPRPHLEDNVSILVYHGMSGCAGYDGGFRLMSDGRLFLGRIALCLRVAFFCTWCATARRNGG
jgi:hypothetical protein